MQKTQLLSIISPCPPRNVNSIESFFNKPSHLIAVVVGKEVAHRTFKPIEQQRIFSQARQTVVS
jgi:hypothetical protein